MLPRHKKRKQEKRGRRKKRLPKQARSGPCTQWDTLHNLIILSQWCSYLEVKKEPLAILRSQDWCIYSALSFQKHLQTGRHDDRGALQYLLAGPWANSLEPTLHTRSISLSFFPLLWCYPWKHEIASWSQKPRSEKPPHWWIRIWHLQMSEHVKQRSHTSWLQQDT